MNHMVYCLDRCIYYSLHFSFGVAGARYFAQRGRGIAGAVVVSDVPQGQPNVQAGVGGDGRKFGLQTIECLVAHCRFVPMDHPKGSQLGSDETQRKRTSQVLISNGSQGQI